MGQVKFKQLFAQYNLGQNIWNNVEKSGKIGQGKKSLTSAFACFLTTAPEV